MELAKEVCGHALSFGEVGCAMSHIRVYERIVAEGIERCVVLEDDIYLHMHSKAIIETIVALLQFGYRLLASWQSQALAIPLTLAWRFIALPDT